ncbi:hypothetical protein QMN58_28125 [Escherichia coli]|nr:hypothetical protein [Escherichia coli]
MRNHQDAKPVAIGALQRHATDWAMARLNSTSPLGRNRTACRGGRRRTCRPRVCASARVGRP